MSNEVQTLAELELRHVEEIGLFEAAQDETSAKLENDFSTQLALHAEFCNEQVPSGLCLGKERCLIVQLSCHRTIFSFMVCFIPNVGYASTYTF